MKKILINAHFLIYLLKFLGVFSIAYFGTMAVIGLSAPGRLYSSTVDNYFNYVSWLRSSLLNASKEVLYLFGYKASVTSRYMIQLQHGFGVRIVYSCIGYGVMSFWLAFVLSNEGTLFKKITWVIGGLCLLWLINVSRICLLLLAINKVSEFPGFNHHTWFNGVCYSLIFLLMYLFDRASKAAPAPAKLTYP